MLFDAPASGLEVVRLFGGWVELETELRLFIPVLPNGFEVVRLFAVVVELGMVAGFPDELGLSSLCESLELEFSLELVAWFVLVDCEACCVFEIFGMVYLMAGEPMSSILLTSASFELPEPVVVVDEVKVAAGVLLLLLLLLLALVLVGVAEVGLLLVGTIGVDEVAAAEGPPVEGEETLAEVAEVDDDVEMADELAVTGLVLVTVNLRPPPELPCLMANWSPPGGRDFDLLAPTIPSRDESAPLLFNSATVSRVDVC